MNSKNDDSTMKKIFMMICAAAAVLAGCQNVEEGIEGGAQSGLSIKAVATVPTMNRTHLVESEGVYKAWWSDGDYVNLVENANGTISRFLTQITEDCESAELTFEDINPQEADEYKYVLTYPDPVASNTIVIDMSIPTEQNFFRSDSYADNCDILLSKPVTLDHQPVGESINFEMVRLSAVAKMTLKNFAIPAGEVIEDVTFSCDSPITGEFSVNIDGISAEGTPIEITKGVNSVSTNKYEPITDPATQQVVVYFSVLPTTLKAGESYTITVETDKANYHKTANFACDLRFQAGAITSFSASMQDAGVKAITTPIENNFEGYYAIGYTENGVTYLLPNTETGQNPALTKLGEGDLNALTIQNGVIKGKIADNYMWSIVVNGDKDNRTYSFRCQNSHYLISCPKAQGLAVSNTGKGSISGQTYVNTFTLTSKEGGYDMKNSTCGRWVKADAANNRWGQPTGAPAGTINFYRIVTPSMQKSVYPVITDAAHVTEGTYAILFKNATKGTYYTMKNDATLSALAAIPFSELNLTLENNLVAAAGEIADEYKWVFDRLKSGDLNIRSAKNKNYFFRQKNNSGGMGVMTGEEYDAAKEAGTITGVYESAWNFINTNSGMQAFAGANERHLGVNADGTNWAGFKAGGLIGEIILVKLSNSTEQIVSE